MEFPILFMLVYWCYSTSANEKAQEDIYYNNVEKLKVLKCIKDSNAWQKHFNTQEVIFNEHLMNLSLYKNPTQQDRVKLENMKQNEMENGLTENEMPEKSVKLKHTQNLMEQNRYVLNFLFQTSNIIYLTIKCKYSGLIIDSLRLFNDIISSCQTIKQPTHRNNCINDTIKHFVEQKQYIVRMIYNLFNFIDAFPNVKFANLILLKSLISINLFLDYRKNYAVNNMNKNNSIHSENEKKTIVQMMNFIERFRCQKCNVFNYNYDSDNSEITKTIGNHENNDSFEKPIKTLFKPMAESLESCSEIISLKSPDGQMKKTEKTFVFSEEMYDAKYLVLAYTIVNNEKYSKINNINVKGRNMAKEMAFGEIIRNALIGYDLKTIFDCQMLFIDVIIDLCNIQFINMSKIKMSTDVDGTLFFGAVNLLTKTQAFVGSLPSNYPQSELLKLYGLIGNDIDSLAKYQTYLLRDYVVNKIKIKTIVNWQSNRFLKDPLPVSDLIGDVVQHKYFDGFVRVLRLFLSEPNTLDEYRLYDAKTPMRTTDGKVCFTMSQLKENLILFHILVSGRNEAEDGTDFVLLKAMDSMNVYLAHVHDEYGTNDEIVKMLVPIAMRFRNVRYTNFDRKGYSMLGQHSLLTANMLEHFEINNCAMVVFSDEMHSNILNDGKIFKVDNGLIGATDFDENYIGRYILRDKKTPKADDKYVFLSWVDKFIPNYFSKYYNSVFNSTTINWAGTEDHVNDVVSSVKEDIIDYNHLVRFQIMQVKWCVYNVFKKMLYIAEHRDEYRSEANFFINPDQVVLETIMDDLARIQRLPFPKPISKYLKPIFLKYTNIFVSADGPEEKKNVLEIAQKCALMIREQLEYLEVTALEHLVNEYDMDDLGKISLDRIHEELVDDYSFLSNILKPPEKDAIKLISEDDFFYVY